MSLTIDEAIARFEANAEQNERWASGGLNPEANAEYAAEHRQLAAWLRELKERRKEPKIIRCKDCKHYEWMSNRIPEEQTWHCHCWDADTGKDDFCSYAERRTDAND